MDTKLTLTIEKEIIEQAKLYAKRKGRSLSELIENYLMFLTVDKKEAHELTPKVRKLLGSIKLPHNFDNKKAYSEYLSKKYQ